MGNLDKASQKIIDNSLRIQRRSRFPKRFIEQYERYAPQTWKRKLPEQCKAKVSKQA